LKKIDELEEKNKEANKKISSLESEVDSLKKEKNKMNKELNQLKQMFLSMKTKIDSLNVQKMNNPFKAENTINQKERFKTLNSVENSKKKLKNNLELINDEQYNNIIPRNTLENNDINYLNNKDKNFNNKKIPLDGDDRNNSKK
jgi:chromosome segregation ATPase